MGGAPKRRRLAAGGWRGEDLNGDGEKEGWNGFEVAERVDVGNVGNVGNEALLKLNLSISV